MVILDTPQYISVRIQWQYSKSKTEMGVEDDVGYITYQLRAVLDLGRPRLAKNMSDIYDVSKCSHSVPME